jgi:exodeoxyribonuclease V beta subunit
LARFLANPEIGELLTATADRHAIPPGQRMDALRLLHAALTTPIGLGARSLAGGLAEAGSVVREMEFLYPYPEADHPPLGSTQAKARFRIERGYIQGFIDLLFVHDERVYLADWKSDLLGRAPTKSALDAHVAKHYALQAKIYALALLKLLRIRDRADYEARVGGLLYIFLRHLAGSDAEGGGVSFGRPSWEELRSWEAELVERR